MVWIEFSEKVRDIINGLAGKRNLNLIEQV
jgi:hypothetical protein